jgi:hypothetical protein
MKQTIFIPLSFVASPQTTANIHIPFTVRKIHVKALGYQAGTNGTTKYVMLRSSLGLNSPLGILNQDSTYSSATVNDIEIELKNPEVIQGNYTFTLLYMDGTIAQTSNNGSATDTVGLVIEFNSPDEIL